jgi:GTP cyclohydrolase II
MASYPLPVRPMDGAMVLEEAQVHELLDIVGDESKVTLQKLSYNEHFKVTLDPELLSAARRSTTDSALTGFIGKHPYWFNDHVYHDRIAHLDFVALVYNQNPDAVPAVRVQSENLLQRLPLRAEDRSLKYQHAIQEIVDNGRGMLLLYPEDGRGKGFSALFLEQSLVDQGIAKDNAEAVELLGCRDEMRDFRSLATLIRHHYPEQPIKLLLGSAGSGSVAGLRAHGVEIADTVLLK